MNRALGYVFGCSEKQNQYIIYVYQLRDFQHLAHGIVEAGKSRIFRINQQPEDPGKS